MKKKPVEKQQEVESNERVTLPKIGMRFLLHGNVNKIETKASVFYSFV